MSPTALTVTGGLLLTGADGVEPFVGWLRVGRDGRISGVGPGEPPPDPEPGPGFGPGPATVLDATGKIVAPGFVSAHSHLHTSGLRGLGAEQTLYGWLRANVELLLGASDEDLYWCVLHGCLDVLAHGITSAYNFTLGRAMGRYDPGAEHAGPELVRGPGAVDRQLAATADSGLRVLTALRLDDEVLGPDEAAAGFDRAVAEVTARTPVDRHLGVSVYGAVQWSPDPATAELEAATMSRYGITNQAHFVETAENLPAQQAKFDWYARAGALGPTMLFGHFVHPTDAMVEQVARSGAAVVWQPASNGRLGSGVADIPRYRDRGIRVGIGVDDQSCTDTSDPFGSMRAGLYTQRAARCDAAVLGAREVLRMHTLGAAEVLGVADRVGSLEVGKYADFLVVDPTEPDIGPIWDPWASYVLACGQRNLTAVHVGGRLRAEHGRVVHPLAGRAGPELHARLARAAASRGLAAPWAR